MGRCCNPRWRCRLSSMSSHDEHFRRSGMEELAKDPYSGCDSEAMFRALEKAVPTSPPGCVTVCNAPPSATV
eukprot:3143158-Rhodomonas_salina.2